MKEIVFLSGKGGTGKTSVLAGFATLTRPCVLTDCDVDAADLHILLNPEILENADFIGGKVASINQEKCINCGKCRELCRFGAITGTSGEIPSADTFHCEGCGVCARFCPADAITMVDAVSGQWQVSRTRVGPMIHAQLSPVGENSGKLVTLLRNRGRELAAEKGIDWVLSDGSPGIGCPVIASLTGAEFAVIVTEAGAAAVHDLERLMELVGHFGTGAGIVINRYDLSEEMTKRIEKMAAAQGIPIVGKIPFDPEINQAQLLRKSVTEHGVGPAAKIIPDIRDKVFKLINDKKKQS